MSRLALPMCALLLIGCSSSGSGTPEPSAELTVFAASSLTAAFTQLGKDFEETHPGLRVSFTFAASTDLAEQIPSGAAGADVFASASSPPMDAVERGPGVTDRADFATNHLAIVTPPDNPAGVVSLDSLTTPMALVIGAEGTPIGDYTREMLDAQGLEHAVLTNVVANEPDDASIVADVESGEVDAGIVYSSDIPTTGGKLYAIEIPPHLNVTAVYPIAVVNGSARDADAKAFVGFVLSDHGQVVLDSRGFEPPAR